MSPEMPMRALAPDEDFFAKVEALDRELEEHKNALAEAIDWAVETGRLEQAKADEWMPFAVNYDPAKAMERAQLTGALEDPDIRQPLLDAKLYGAFEGMQSTADLLHDVKKDVIPNLPGWLLRL